MNYADVWRVGVFWLVLVVFFPLGKAMADLVLDSSFSVSQSYTSNLFFEDETQEDDFGFFAGPNFRLQFDNPDVVIGVTYTGRASFFINNPNANRYNQNANINLDLPFLTKRYENLTVTIDESMNFTPQLDAFSLSGAQDASTSGSFNQNAGTRGVAGGTGGTGVFTTRGSAFNNNAGIVFGYAWTPRVQSSLGYSNNYLHFFSKGFQDSLTHTGHTSSSYQATKLTSLNASYSYSQTEFIGKSTRATSADRIISHNPQLGILHTFSPTLSGSLSGGVSFTKQFGATEQIEGPGGLPILGPDGIPLTRKISEKFSRRFIGSAIVSKNYTRGTMGVSFSQSVGSGAGLAAQSTTTRSVAGRIAHTLTQRMNADASVGWATNDSVRGNAFDSTTWRIQTGLGYQFLSWLSGDFGYSHIKQSSSGSAATDLNVDQFFLALTATADPWYIFR